MFSWEENNIRSSGATWKMGCAHGYLAASGLDQYLKKLFPATLRPPLLGLHAQSNRALHTTLFKSAAGRARAQGSNGTWACASCSVLLRLKAWLIFWISCDLSLSKLSAYQSFPRALGNKLESSADKVFSMRVLLFCKITVLTFVGLLLIFF